MFTIFVVKNEWQSHVRLNRKSHLNNNKLYWYLLENDSNDGKESIRPWPATVIYWKAVHRSISIVTCLII